MFSLRFCYGAMADFEGPLADNPVVDGNVAPKTTVTHAHTHGSISQPLSAYDVFSPPLSVVAPPLAYDHVTEAAASKGHPTATGVITRHHHGTNTHTVPGRNERERWD